MFPAGASGSKKRASKRGDVRPVLGDGGPGPLLEGRRRPVRREDRAEVRPEVQLPPYRASARGRVGVAGGAWLARNRELH